MTVQAMSPSTGAPGGRPRSVVLLCAVALVAAVLHAEPAATQNPAAATPTEGPATAPAVAPSVTAGLEGIPGVRAGMTTKELVEVGLEALRDDRLAISRQILLAVVAQDRQSVLAIGSLGYAYERSAEQARADRADPQAGEKAVAYIQQAVDVYMEAGDLALRSGDNASAEQLYGRVLVHRPGHGPAVLGLARVYGKTGRRLQAIDRYRVYLQTPEGQGNAKAYLDLAELYLEDDLWRQALEHLTRAQQLDAANADVDIALARAYQRAERFNDALAAAKAAVDRDPQEPRYRYVRAQVLLSAGEPEQASLEAQRAVELGRAKLAEAPDKIARMRTLADYSVVWEQTLTRLLDQRPTDVSVRADLGRVVKELAVIRQQIDLHRALRILSAVPADSDPHVKLLEQLAEVQAALGKKQEAAETCRRLLDTDPENATGKRLLAECRSDGAPPPAP